MSKKKLVVKEDNLFDNVEELLGITEAVKPVSVEETKEELMEIGEPEKTFSTQQAQDVFYNKETKKFVQVLIDYNLEHDYAKINAVSDLTDNIAVAVAKTAERTSRKLFKTQR
jgi:hypothetical protein